jgi:four helix bundle protein
LHKERAEGQKGRKAERRKGGKAERRKGGKEFFLKKFKNSFRFREHFACLATPTSMENKYHSFEDLLIWQLAMELCDEVYEAMKNCKDFGLRDQMQRSSVSIPSNIAEGFELHTNKAFIRHLYISKGSGGELRTQLYVAIRRTYIDAEKGGLLVAKTKKLGGMIYNFILTRKNRTRKSSP